MSVRLIRSRWLLVVALIALVLAALACEFSVGTTTGSLTVINNSSIEICYIYISPSDQGEWGDDWLGEEETIPPGESHEFTDIEAGTYDFAAADCDGNEVDTEQGVEIEAGSNITWTFTDN